jgi:HD-like signal output (HDOD) protein
MDLAEIIRSTCASPQYKPPLLPKIALELHELSRRSEISAVELVRMIETDPTIASLVLRRAQTAFYSGGLAIRTLKEAVVRLGFRAVGDLFLEAAMASKVFRAPGFEAPMERLRLHSAATAHIAHLVARAAGVDAEHVFLASLMHDVGAAMAVIVLADRGRREPLPKSEVLWPAVYDAHESLGNLLCELWKLPAEVASVVGHHHDPDFAGSHPVVACVALAESLATQVGFSALADPSPPTLRAAEQLALGPGEIGRLTREAEKVADTLR